MNELKLGLEDALGILRKRRVVGSHIPGNGTQHGDWSPRNLHSTERAIAAIEHLQTAVESGDMIDCRELR